MRTDRPWHPSRGPRGCRELCAAWALLAFLGGSQSAAAVDITAPAIDMTMDEAATPASPTALELHLAERVATSSKDASAWRLLGRARMQRQDWQGALDALRQAVELDQRSAAAFLDYGRTLRHFGQTSEATAAWQRVLALAPETEYAVAAEQELSQLASADDVQLASYDIRTYDGSNFMPQVVGPEPSFWKPWQDALRIRFDLGSQYNSNVTLAPSSRELQDGGQDSAQGNASLLVQWYAINRLDFRLGPSFDSDFTLNENQFQSYNLQSYRPGLFAEGTWETERFTLRPRVAYTFTHDEFHGRTYGNRHALATSLGNVWSPGNVTTLYYAVDQNNVANDGVDPNLSSQDGWSHAVGCLHDVIDRDSVFRHFRLGGDFAFTNTIGSNYRYRAISLFAQEVLVLVPRLHLTLKGGYAYRDYYAAQVTPSRNTNILRASAELRRYLDYGFSAAIFVGYDRFLSRNDQYNTDRFQTGGIITWEF